MPSIYDQLKEAQLENYSGIKSPLSRGLIWLDTSLSIPKLKYYDGTVTRTLAIGASGGGGGSLIWVPDDTSLSPASVIENFEKVWKFIPAVSASIYTLVKVPSSYSSGDPISAKLNYYGPDTGGTALLSSIATLIRVGTDAFDSTTNQRTSTNVAVAMSATANLLFALTLDITSSTGTINSVAVSAGDVIKVQLFRGTDTASDDIRFIESSTEVTFS